ncbi:MAG: hypothetical protein V1936_03840 [Patescibacteria group bacterium]
MMTVRILAIGSLDDQPQLLSLGLLEEILDGFSREQKAALRLEIFRVLQNCFAYCGEEVILLHYAILAIAKDLRARIFGLGNISHEP